MEQKTFKNFTVERVANGFILRLDDYLNRSEAFRIDNVYVFNDLVALSDFIKNLDNE